MRLVEVRIGVVPCPPFLKTMAQGAYGLEGVPFRSSRIEVPLADISRAVACITECLPEAVLGWTQRMRVVDDTGLVRPPASHQNAAVGRADRVVGDALRERCPLGSQALERRRLGIVEGLARHRARPMLVAEYKEDVRSARYLSPPGHRCSCGQAAQNISSGRVPRYHDLGILATLGRPWCQQFEPVTASAK